MYGLNEIIAQNKAAYIKARICDPKPKTQTTDEKTFDDLNTLNSRISVMTYFRSAYPEIHGRPEPKRQAKTYQVVMNTQKVQAAVV